MQGDRFGTKFVNVDLNDTLKPAENTMNSAHQTTITSDMHRDYITQKDSFKSSNPANLNNLIQVQSIPGKPTNFYGSGYKKPLQIPNSRNNYQRHKR